MRPIRTAVTIITFALVASACSADPAVHTTLSTEPTSTTYPIGPTVGREAENLMAFARLVNYVRFFHPSDEATRADWGAFSVSVLPQVESADDPFVLAAVLQDAFESVAPTIAVYSYASPPSTNRLDGLSGTAVAAWMHRGVVTPETIQTSGPYASERVIVPSDTVLPDWFPSPSEPLVVDLGAGIAASIPLAVHIEDGDSVPATASPDAPWLNASSPQITYRDFPSDQRSTKQAALILTWGYFQHFYPYWDVVDTDWGQALSDTLTLTLVEESELDLETLLRRLLASAHDGHATVTDPSPDRATPPIRWRWIEERLVISNLTGSAPPEIPIGSIVTQIGGEDVVTVVERAEYLVPAASPQRRRHEALATLLEGPWGSMLDLTAQTPPGDTVEVSLKRTGAPFWRGVLTEEPRPDPITEVAPGVGYLDLTRATLPLGTGFVFDTLIVDLRGYPTADGFELFAHLLAAPVRSDRLLVPVTTRPDGEGRTYEDEAWVMEPETPRFGSEIVFLADERAQSASETLLGMVEDNGIGEVLGSPTGGTNGNVVRFITPGGYRIAFTAMKVTDSDGTTHHGIGVLPTVPINQTITGVTDGRDELLDAAVALLLG